MFLAGFAARPSHHPCSDASDADKGSASVADNRAVEIVGVGAFDFHSGNLTDP